MNEQTRLAELLRNLAVAVESMTDDEFGRLDFKRLLRPVPRSPKKSKTTQDFKELVELLRAATTYLEAEATLTAARLPRRQLDELAKLLDVPTRKSEERDDVVLKILNSVIGYKLNSEAIRAETPR